MSETILSELQSKQIINEKGVTGRRLVTEKFTFKKNAIDFLKLYESVV